MRPEDKGKKVKEKKFKEAKEKKPEKPEDVQALVKEATDLKIYIPPWVDGNKEIYYRLAYLQVKKDNEASMLPARDRIALIKAIMSRLIAGIHLANREKRMKEKKDKENAVRKF